MSPATVNGFGGSVVPIPTFPVALILILSTLSPLPSVPRVLKAKYPLAFPESIPDDIDDKSLYVDTFAELTKETSPSVDESESLI